MMDGQKTLKPGFFGNKLTKIILQVERTYIDITASGDSAEWQQFILIKVVRLIETLATGGAKDT